MYFVSPPEKPIRSSMLVPQPLWDRNGWAFGGCSVCSGSGLFADGA